MTENDKRILARACGLLCWHESDNPNVVGSFKEGGGLIYQTCKHCGKLISTSYQTLLLNPTFTTPDDWELVWSKFEKNKKWQVLKWLKMSYQLSPMRMWLTWELKPPEEKCQDLSDFIKSRPDLFPWVKEMVEKGGGRP